MSDGERSHVAAIDQGTTGTRCVVFDEEGHAAGSAYHTHEQLYPRPGWVEHDPKELLARTREAVQGALADAGLTGEGLAAVGIANQRETTLLWEADTGEPVGNAIVWQDRRTVERIEGMDEALAEHARERTGLEPDAYFSASKLEWLLDREDRRERAADGELLAGTVDSWLLRGLTGDNVHATDVTNASRTMLFDVHELAWDDRLLEAFGVPRACLPEVRPSSGAFGRTDPDGAVGAAVPVGGVLGDQQAALFGQTCFGAGEAKSTYGTGSFLLLNTGPEPASSDNGLLTTIAYQRAGEAPRYALEGSVYTTGAAVEWLVDLGLVEDAAASEAVALSVDSPEGVYVVPAFSGLGAPYWDGRARGTVVGLTRGSRRAHLVRATLESVAFRTRDVVEAMVADSGLEPELLRVDGGATANGALCQLQADALDSPVVRPAVTETTALGAAYAAGLATGVWTSLDQLREQWRVDRRFEPADPAVAARYGRWGEAVDRARDWAREE
jgi:glycerol kinase